MGDGYTLYWSLAQITVYETIVKMQTECSSIAIYEMVIYLRNGPGLHNNNSVNSFDFDIMRFWRCQTS